MSDEIPAPNAAAAASQIVAETPVPARDRRRLKWVLLGGVPLLALLIGLGVYLYGGRYVSTDNAYVGADKVFITPDVSGRVTAIAVSEGQLVKAGDPLFEIDAAPYRLALEESEARLAAVRAGLAMQKANLSSLTRQIDIQNQSIALRQSDLDRKVNLLNNRFASQTDVETTKIALTAAQAQLELLKQQQAGTLLQLLGDPTLPEEKYPAYREALANRDKARRDLDNTVMRAPLAGVATQVPAIQLGRYLSAGTTVMAIVGSQNIWVDANPKETDLEHVHNGEAVTISVDAYPGRSFQGFVEAVSPATGGQFSILPAQNASGNWVKVVQRVPVRIRFAPGEDTQGLRVGMSANVDIDTGRKRSLAGLLGLTATADTKPAP